MKSKIAVVLCLILCAAALFGCDSGKTEGEPAGGLRDGDGDRSDGTDRRDPPSFGPPGQSVDDGTPPDGGQFPERDGQTPPDGERFSEWDGQTPPDGERFPERDGQTPPDGGQFPGWGEEGRPSAPGGFGGMINNKTCSVVDYILQRIENINDQLGVSTFNLNA